MVITFHCPSTSIVHVSLGLQFTKMFLSAQKFLTQKKFHLMHCDLAPSQNLLKKSHWSYA